MKRTITTLALVASMMLLAIPTALATHEDEAPSRDKAGYGESECRPGAQNNDIVGSWELKEQGAFTEELQASAEARHAHGYYIGTRWEEDLPGLLTAIENSLDATWEFCDKNRDTFLCVMKQTFPDGAPFNSVYTLLDNRPFHK